MSQHVNPPVAPSAAAHAERIRAREQRADGGQSTTGQSTAERIAAQILPGYRRDEELRQAARMRELQARGVITADSEPEDVEEEDVEDEEPEADGEEEQPLTTAERYAAIERARQTADRQATMAAHRGAVQATVQPAGHRYAEQLAQPHRYAHVWQNPAS
jgi:hypothetical protein